MTYQYQLKNLVLLWPFFIAACHSDPGAERNFAGSSSYILIKIFLKFLNTSANNNVSL